MAISISTTVDFFLTEETPNLKNVFSRKIFQKILFIGITVITYILERFSGKSLLSFASFYKSIS